MRPLRHVGPALATSIAAWLNVALLSVFLRRHEYLRPDRKLISSLVRMIGATGVMAAALLGARHLLVPELGQHVSAAALGMLIATGLVAYGAVAQGLGVFDATGLVRRGIKRFSRI